MFSKACIAFVVLAASLAAAVPSVRKRTTCSNGKTTTNDACCVWFDVLDDIQENLFHGGQCGEDAHESLRLTFHDALAYSPALTAEGKFGGGGADGSIIAHSDVELTYPVNDGLDEIVEASRPFAIKHNVSFGDFIQFAGAVGAANCNGGPQVSFYAGRSNDSQAAPDNLIPLPSDSADSILSRFSDAGFDAVEVVWLLVSHTVGSQNTVDPSIVGAPFDSTPSDFDAQFFVETMLNGTLIPGDALHDGEVLSPYPGEFRLQSDFELSRDNRTACEWQTMIANRTNMLQKFEVTMLKMSLLGFNQSDLTDCSDVIPTATGTVQDPFLPAGLSVDDLQSACSTSAFPSVSTVSGTITTIAAVATDS
uniref:Peroxidase n=1 Tax=Ganoderma boninense TaxID=34458 RepID=A0A7U3S168_9APHY|nr:manganese peroxidase GbMnP_U35959 [Ganoderma boninense]